MKTEVKLGAALKDLMTREPLDKITVKRLTDMCGINRQTFYYHFRDIYDLLTWIYLNESIQEIKGVTNWKEGVRACLNYISKNSVFVKNTLSSAGRDLFMNFIYSSVYNANIRVLTKADEKGILTSDDKRFVASFITPSFVSLITRWADSDGKESIDSLLKRIDILMDGYIYDVIERFAKNKGEGK